MKQSEELSEFNPPLEGSIKVVYVMFSKSKQNAPDLDVFRPFFDTSISLKKPGSSETPPQITKKATNTALGIAAMAASFAPNSTSNTPNQNQQSTSATSKGQ